MNLEKLKDTARKYEQKEDWRRAIDVYLKAIHEFESGKDQHPDLSLYNRVGDLYMKVNDTAAAVRSYERAADLYTEQGFLNNAIALCGKILRVNPSRTQIYFKLAQIHARKNMVVDAKRHLVEFLERMNRGGQLDDAFKAVKIFADQFSANQEIRLMLIELLRAASREEEAKEQLEKLAGELEARGDRVGALRTREQIEALEAGQPLTLAAEDVASPGGLVFLDTGGQGKARRVPTPSARVPTPAARVPTPAARMPTPAPREIPPTPPAFEVQPEPLADLVMPETADVREAEVEARSLEFLDVGAPLEAPAGDVAELEALVEEPSFAEPADTSADGMLLGDIELTASEGPVLETVEPLEGLERIDPDEVEAVRASSAMELMLEPSFDPVEEIEARPLDGLELVATDLEVRGLEGRADEPPPSDTAQVVVEFPGGAGEFDEEDAEASHEDEAGDTIELDDEPELAAPSTDAGAQSEFSVDDLPDAPLVEALPADDAPAQPDFTVVAGEPWRPTSAARSVEELEELVLDNPEDADVHRELGEALLLQGETARAVDEFELALSAYEGGGDQERAESVLALLITLQSDDVRFYQRRVEYAYRTGDREHLLGAYLDLADVLARVQAEEKAIAVYWRVLEHDPENSRAQLALQLLGVLDLDGASSEPPSVSSSEEEPESFDEPLEDERGEASAETHVEAAATNAQASHVTAPFVPHADATPGAAARPLPPPGDFVDLGSLVLDAEERPRDTRMLGRQLEPTGDEQRDFEDMLAQFKKGIDENVDLDDYQAHYDLGIAFKEMGLLDEAVAEFQRALRAPEGRLRTSEALGMCFYEKGQLAVAEAVLRRAVDTLPGGDDEKIGLIYWLGRSAEEQGKAEEARTLYERALAVDIRFQDTNERIHRLMTGRQ